MEIDDILHTNNQKQGEHNTNKGATAFERVDSASLSQAWMSRLFCCVPRSTMFVSFYDNYSFDEF